MRQMIVSTTNVTGASAPLVMNLNATPFNVGFGVVVTGTPTYTVQHTFDNLSNYDATASGFTTWFNHPTIASQTINADGNYAFPVSGIRVNVTGGTGTATLTVIQAGIA